MTQARYKTLTPGVIETQHVWTRCVQQAFLCGYDSRTGRDYSPRREIVHSMLKYQASVFAVDVGNHAILGNHFHLILRSRPDIVETWSDEECAWRYKLAWPNWEGGQWTRIPSDEAIKEVLQNPIKLQRARETLSSISHFMSQSKQPLALIFNREAERKGTFWDKRFSNRRLITDEETLGCSFYCDLNQVRAGMADELVESEPSAVRERILAEQSRADWVAANSQEYWDSMMEEMDVDLMDLEPALLEKLFGDCWLAPISDQGPLATSEDEVASEFAGQSAQVALEVRARTKQRLPNWIPDPICQDDEPIQQESEAEAESANKSKPKSKRTYEMHRKWRKRLKRRKSDRCFLNCSWFSYLKAVKALADSFAAERQNLPAEAESPEEDWKQSGSTTRGRVSAFLRRTATIISDVLPRPALPDLRCSAEEESNQSSTADSSRAPPDT